jgi:putative ABC transport system permease protein
LQKLYESEDRLSKVATVFSGFGIVVACLGLFGLASFTAEQRRKEIGIRKALGSTTSQILVLLSSEFAKLIAIAFILAVPISYLSLDAWLNDFAYRIDINWTTFIVAGLVSFIVAIATVGYQSVRAAISNPVEALRNES